MFTVRFRYVLVIFPTKRERQHNLSLIFFSLIWLISIMLALPLYTASDLKQLFSDERCEISVNICHEQNVRWQSMIISKDTYTVAVLVIQYALPLASIAFVYSRIASRMGTRLANRRTSTRNNNNNSLTTTAQTVQSPHVGSGGVKSMDSTQAAAINEETVTASPPDRQNRSTSVPAINSTTAAESNERRRKSLADRHRRTNLLLISIVIIFAFAWLPLNCFHLANTFGWLKSYSVPAFALCHIFAICSACLNPLSYAFFNHNFRAEFIAIFQWLGLL